MNTRASTRRIVIGALLFFVPMVSCAATLSTDSPTSTPVELASSCPVAHTLLRTIDIVPKTGTYAVGDNIELRVSATSPDCSIMNIGGKISYNPNAVEVVSITPDASLLTTWQEPAINKDIGEVFFGGAFSTSTLLDGRMLFTIHAIARRVGEKTPITFEYGELVHPNDGSNVIDAFTSGNYRIVPRELGESLEPPESPAAGVPSSGEVLGAATASPAVIISSPTHPNQGAWYNASTSAFLFQYPGAVTGLKLGFDGKRDGRARITYAPIVNTKEVGNLENGIWFLHVSAALSGGGSYETSYQVQVDRTLPENFTAKFIPRDDDSNPDITIAVSATDTYSGVDHYEFALDGGALERWESLTDGRFHHIVASPGAHELTAMVYDKAGNTLSQKISFEVTYLPPPAIAIKDTTLSEGDTLLLDIDSLPGATVNISLSRNGDSPTVEHMTMDSTGKGEFESALTLSPGSYSVVAAVVSAKGGMSKESERIGVTVTSSAWGILSRHPMMLFGILGLLFFGALGLFLFRRMQYAESSDVVSDEEAEEEVVPYEPIRSARNVRDAHDTRNAHEIHDMLSNPGQVILQARTKPVEMRLPPTRL